VIRDNAAIGNWGWHRIGFVSGPIDQTRVNSYVGENGGLHTFMKSGDRSRVGWRTFASRGILFCYSTLIAVSAANVSAKL
jgi:hypothetical protein